MSQLPFGPDDLAGPVLSGTDFLELLEHDFITHTDQVPPLYAKAFYGEVDVENLKVWAKDMFLYWDTLYFSTGAIYIKTNEPTVRSNLLRKLVEVEGRVVVNDVRPDWTTPAYDELWLRFGEGLGLKRDEITSWQTFTRSFFCVSTLCLYSRGWEWSWLDGVANLYAADMINIEYLGRLREPLQRYYNLDDRALQFFDAVVGDAKENVVFEREALAYWACTTERQLTAARAFRERLAIEAQLLVAVDEVIATGSFPFQIPVGATVPALLDRR